MNPIRLLKKWLVARIDKLLLPEDNERQDAHLAALPPIVPPEAIAMITPKPVASTRVEAERPLRGSLADRLKKAR